MIPYGRQQITDSDIAAVLAVLQSDYLTQGPVVPRFEQALCEYTGARRTVVASSGTAVLHLACRALGLGLGDWLWTSPISFVASANCARYCGAGVDFVDIDPETWNVSADKLADKLVQARRNGRLPKVVVPVSFCGRPCDLQAIGALAREFGFAVLEDACHALGARRGGIPVGNSREADITVFSFHPVKLITTAEGGGATTNSETLAERMALLREHGITRRPEQMTHPSEGPWDYQQIELGFNYRMTDIQAALGASQLSRLEAFVQRRHELAARYDHLLSELPVQRPAMVRDGDRCAWHLYVVLVADPGGTQRKQVFDCLRSAGIGVNVHYIPIHTQPYYQGLGFRAGDFPEAERYFRRAITLPLHPTLTEAEQDHVVQTLSEALRG